MRASLDQIEKGYNEYVAKMKEGFNIKCKQYIKIDDNLNANNEFICGHARDVQAIMEDHRDAIIDEKNIEYSKLKSAQLAWKKEIEEIYQKNNFKSPILSLDCGGTMTVKASKALLCSVKGSLLERTFSGYHENTKLADKIFVDRDAKSFQHLVNYLRQQNVYSPVFDSRYEEDLFVKELSFWGIQAPHFGSQAKESALVGSLPKRLVDFMKSEPSGLADNALNRWKQLGAIKF